jgi:hypothetical protein
MPIQEDLKNHRSEIAGFPTYNALVESCHQRQNITGRKTAKPPKGQKPHPILPQKPH